MNIQLRLSDTLMLLIYVLINFALFFSCPEEGLSEPAFWTWIAMTILVSPYIWRNTMEKAT